MLGRVKVELTKADGSLAHPDITSRTIEQHTQHIKEERAAYVDGDDGPS